MTFIKNNKIKIITVVLIALALVVSFMASDKSSQTVGYQTAGDAAMQLTADSAGDASSDVSLASSSAAEAVLPAQNAAAEENGQSGKQVTADNSLQHGQADAQAESANHPAPVEPEQTEITDEELTCTLSVRCDTILTNLDSLKDEKLSFVPKDGVIFAEEEVVFYEGESVFNVLLREMKRSKIHFEFVNTPVYNSAYIEGIGNLYEFDCGELSGWMYKVNGWFPNYGCSRYLLSAGDKIELVYTCDLGADVGGKYLSRDEV